MNKQEMYRQLREELVLQYHTELQLVSSLLKQPATRMANEKVELDLTEKMSSAASGEAARFSAKK